MTISPNKERRARSVSDRALSPDDLARSLNSSWRDLSERYLPFVSDQPQWGYSRPLTAEDPKQGWKLHISATILTAVEVFQRVAPFLTSRGVLFKATASLEELGRINSGLHYGYCQVGKFMTVYPRSDEESVSLARRLDKLTAGMLGPLVPFDLRLREKSCVSYRYGAFRPMSIDNSDGASIPAIRNPDGQLISDSRETALTPAWVVDPFARNLKPRKRNHVSTPLETTFRIFRALTQRGKGGVYQAVDFRVNPPRLCIVKEGRRGGEVGWDGHDGYSRVKNEVRALLSLRGAGVEVPRVYESFEVEGNYYLVTEFIEGESLHARLIKRQRRLDIAHVLRIGIQVSNIVSQLHSIGWLWRDCKPSNLVITRQGEIRPLDFEGACRIDEPAASDWFAVDFTPPEHQSGYTGRCSEATDSYAIGSTMYFLLTGRLLSDTGGAPIINLRHTAPKSVCDTVAELLSEEPGRRPTAEIATHRFQRALASVRRPRLSRG